MVVRAVDEHRGGHGVTGGAGSPWGHGNPEGWQVVRGFLEFVRMPFLPFYLTGADARSPSLFISSGALVCNRGTAQPQPCSLGEPSPCPLGCQAVLAARLPLLPGCPRPVPPSGAAAQGEPPLLPSLVLPPGEFRCCTPRRGQQGHCRHSSQQLPVSLPACWDMGRSTLPPASSWVTNTNAEKHILSLTRSSRPFCLSKNLILHLDISLDTRAITIHRELSGL